jgi:hypothetical protein
LPWQPKEKLKKSSFKKPKELELKGKGNVRIKP